MRNQIEETEMVQIDPNNLDLSSSYYVLSLMAMLVDHGQSPVYDARRVVASTQVFSEIDAPNKRYIERSLSAVKSEAEEIQVEKGHQGNIIYYAKVKKPNASTELVQ